MAALLVLPAELTHAQAGPCSRMLAQALRAEPGPQAVADASALRHFDSSALAVLLDCRREALAGAWKRTGLPGRCPSAHDLRHTFASRCVAAGLSLAELKVIMGHDSIMTTERYIHTYGDTMHAVARKLNLRA